MADFWRFQMICITGSVIRTGWWKGQRLKRRKEATINKQFGATVRTIREAAGISLRELARRLGWTPAYVSDIELGRRNPPGRASQVCAWADAIGVGEARTVELMVLAEQGRPRRCVDCLLTKGVER